MKLALGQAFINKTTRERWQLVSIDGQNVQLRKLELFGDDEHAFWTPANRAVPENLETMRRECLGTLFDAV